MTLPKEWLQEAEKIRQSFVNKSYEGEYSYMGDGIEQGATAYKQAVEKKIEDKIIAFNQLINNTPDFFVDLKNKAISIRDEYQYLLTELQTLKPTSND